MAADSMAVLKSALDMYQAQYTATDKLWSYFSTVTLALVAYTISSDKVTRIVPEAIAAIGTYLAFCMGNFFALLASQRQLLSLANVVRSQGKEQKVDLSTFEPFDTIHVGIFYWGVVLAIVVATVLLVKHREHAAEQAAKAASARPASG